jgi:aryl-alcohol dehydrogenase
METTAAVVREASGQFGIEKVQLDEPRADEVIVRIAGAGICHTDLGALAQYIPFPLPGVLGHEGAGVVEKVGPAVTKVKPGDHVVMGWTTCGTCPACRAGQYVFCDLFFPYNLANGSRPDGSATIHAAGGEVLHGHWFAQSSFALHALGNERSVVKVREDVPLEMLAPMGCGVMTGAGAVINSLKALPGQSIAVFGCGTVGMSAIMAAKASGCTKIVAVDMVPARLEFARELGATHAVNPGVGDAVAQVIAATDGGPDFSLECVGNPKVFRQAVDVLPRRGVCGLVGAVAPKTEVTLNMDLIMNGRAVRGIIEGDAIPDLFIPRLLDMYVAGIFPFDKLITYFDFADINHAVEEMESGRVIKPVLRP